VPDKAPNAEPNLVGVLTKPKKQQPGHTAADDLPLLIMRMNVDSNDCPVIVKAVKDLYEPGKVTEYAFRFDPSLTQLMQTTTETESDGLEQQDSRTLNQSTNQFVQQQQVQ
jgi:hypothetical protein